MFKPTRRDFIKTGAGLIGAGVALPMFDRMLPGATIVKQLAENQAGDGRILVIVELAGGIDGLSVIVPLQQYDTYFSLRPTVGIPKERVLPLFGSSTMGMAPELADLRPIADAGKMAVVQAAGYPNPNLSHDGSRQIWYIGNPDPNNYARGAGWIGRHSALFGARSNSLDTVSVGRSVNNTLYAAGATAICVDGDNTGNYQFQSNPAYPGDHNNQLAAVQLIDANPSPLPYVDLIEKVELDALNSADKVRQAIGAYTSPVSYPVSGRTGGFAVGLRLIAQLATATPALGTRVFYISIGGFDTHANQANYRLPQTPGDQPVLLSGVARSLRAFYDDLIAHDMAGKVVTMIWSEFGRRAAQNESDGTDHGEGNNVILLGGQIKGGVYGADPSLTDLNRGNLKYKIDFRQVYATLIRDWLGGDPAAVLNGSFNSLGFIA
jgi:uncharacterized protein (DUF1501 family)